MQFDELSALWRRQELSATSYSFRLGASDLTATAPSVNKFTQGFAVDARISSCSPGATVK